MNMIDNEDIVITCHTGIEEALIKELNGLNIKPEDSGNGFVSIKGGKNLLYMLNMTLRTALHVLKPVKTIFAKDYDHMYQQLKKINWHKMIPYDKSMRIDVKGNSDVFNNFQYTIHRVKDAVLDTIRKFNEDKRPDINKTNPDFHIVLYIYGKKIIVYMDSSGEPLFKRGYRTEQVLAPIKEDLAAGLLLLSDWDKKTDVLDPMCGSGTFLIEAYRIANNIPPNAERKFSFMNWNDYDKDMHESIKEDMKVKINKNQVKFHGFEKDMRTYYLAKNMIKDLNYDIDIENRDFRDSPKKFENFFIISNPPYGERLKEDDIIMLYKEIGDFLKQKCKNAKASIFTANLKAGKFIGLKTSKKTVINNGPLEGRLLQFIIY